MIAYIVTTGDYSDYRIAAVFSNAETAEAYASRINRAFYSGNEASVEEWEVDHVMVLDNDDIAFKVSFLENSRPGYNNRWWANADEEAVDLPYTDVRVDKEHDIWGGAETVWSTWVWAYDENDALKKGTDRIAPVLADAGIDGIELEESERYSRRDTPFLDMIGKGVLPTGKTQEWGFRNKTTVGDYTADSEILLDPETGDLYRVVPPEGDNDA